MSASIRLGQYAFLGPPFTGWRQRRLAFPATEKRFKLLSACLHRRQHHENSSRNAQQSSKRRVPHTG